MPLLKLLQSMALLDRDHPHLTRWCSLRRRVGDRQLACCRWGPDGLVYLLGVGWRAYGAARQAGSVIRLTSER